MAEADRAGQGSSYFRAFLRDLPAEIELARERGLPVELVVDAPLPAHAQRLMDTLGVPVEVRPVSDDTMVDRVHRGSGVRTEGNYVVPAYASTGDGESRPDWIGYRASIASVHKREQAGDEPLTCPACGTETDVTEVVHSPKCTHLATAGREPEGLDLLEQMDRGERIARPATSEGEAMPEVVCKIDGCDGDASDAPKKGFTARLCARHRAEKSAQVSAARTGRPRSSRSATGGGNVSKKARSRTVRRRSRTAKSLPTAVPDRVAANGSHASKAERLLAAARAVDEIEAQLAKARAELKEAATQLA